MKALMTKAMIMKATTKKSITPLIKRLYKDERGEVNMIAIILIIIVVIALVAIFRDSLEGLLRSLFQRVQEDALEI